jgi:hypothetical protein
MRNRWRRIPEAPSTWAAAIRPSVTFKTLSHSAKTLAAQTESGSYRGRIIGETEHHLIQRQSAHTAVGHPKDLLDRQPRVGESVRISYSDSKGRVREFHERAKAQDLGR